MGAKGSKHTPAELRNPNGWPHTEEQRLARLARMREYQRAKRAADPTFKDRERAYRELPGVRQRMNDATNRYRTERRALLHEIKMASGCIDCGYNAHAEALVFDHVRGEKLFELGSAVWARRDRLDAEIAKCDIVCANCHAIRTATRRGEA